MNRRGHLSHKIPNVKIRPAPVASTSNVKTRKGKSRDDTGDEVWREQYVGNDEDEEGDVIMDGSYRPWKEVVITFTGIEDKVPLSKMVKELGGGVESALTVHVTHVVATGFGSAKYNYAVEHRLPVMTPEWIADAYEAWKQGENLDMDHYQETHRLLPFTDLKIAISGIENIERRKQIIHWINVSGGTYSKDLDRTCTHLVSAKITSDSKSSEKVKWALKEIQSRETSRRRGKKMDGEDMKIVYEEWIWDCVGYRGRWKEDGYDARKSRPKGRVDIEEVLDGSIFHRDKQKQAKEEEGDEPAVLKKRKREAMDTLVGELISTTSKNDIKAKSDNVEIPPLEGEDTAAEEILEQAVTRQGRREPERKPSMLHITRNAAFSTPPVPAASSRFSPNLPPTVPLPASTLLPDTAQPAGETANDGPAPTPKFYDGLRFSHVIQEDCKGLVEALLAHGGIFIPDEERIKGAEVDYIIVRLNSTQRPTIPDGDKCPEIVTECWVEGCCHELRMISPDDHIVFRPLPAPMPVPGAEKLNVHLSTWSSGEAVYLKRLLRAIGGKLSEKMNRQTTHLVTSTLNSQKARKAPEWGVNIVSDTWLFEIGRTGMIPPESDYPVKSTMSAPPVVSAGRQLLNGVDSTANMSVISEAGEPNFRAQTVSALSPVRGTPAAQGVADLKAASQRSAPISPSRMLKLTPTHIDDKNGQLQSSASGSMSMSITINGPAGGSMLGTSAGAGPSSILSPPKTETARLLNSASPSSSKGVKRETLESKIGRTASAPPNSESMKKSDPINALRASSTGVAKSLVKAGMAGEGPLGKKDMTEVLRQLAEDTPTSRTKIQRRPRQNGRLKSSAIGDGLSPLARASLSPMKPISPADVEPDRDIHMDSDIQEETIRVIHKDPAAEREKKKLLDALRRGQKVDDAASAGLPSPSPSKRTRTSYR